MTPYYEDDFVRLFNYDWLTLFERIDGADK